MFNIWNNFLKSPSAVLFNRKLLKNLFSPTPPSWELHEGLKLRFLNNFAACKKLPLENSSIFNGFFDMDIVSWGCKVRKIFVLPFCIMKFFFNLDGFLLLENFIKRADYLGLEFWLQKLLKHCNNCKNFHNNFKYLYMIKSPKIS